MTIYQENLSILWGSLIIDELVRNDIDYYCISPGSRSTPLTVAVARHPDVKNIVIYDERSAAFHALGYARGSGKRKLIREPIKPFVSSIFLGIMFAGKSTYRVQLKK
jgi:hypothetical protein